MRRLFLAIAALIAVASPMPAQQDAPTSVEIRSDGTLPYRDVLSSGSSRGFNVTTPSIPIQQDREAMSVPPEPSIEPSFPLTTDRTSCNGCSSSTTYGVGVGAVDRFSTDRRTSNADVPPSASLFGKADYEWVLILLALLVGFGFHGRPR